MIIHSSPFLRCVQTSIAISSGMSQYNGHNAVSKFDRADRAPPASRSRGESSQERSSRPLSTINDEEGDFRRQRGFSPSGSNTRIKLRLDAFLGEWLSPEYYESITPPPDSVLMLAGAKAELLHRGEPVSAEERHPTTVRRKNSTTGLWGSPTMTPPDTPTNEFDDEDDVDLDLPLHPIPRSRTASHSSDGGSLRLAMRGVLPRKTGYVPPTPVYAISPQDPIPSGYVAHARDHCVDVDIHWDSMRPPQNWGDGGKFGEEWSSMHRRFRNGLDSMISWYRHHVESSHQRGGHLRTRHPPSPYEEEDEDTDTVLVLVSHGAGCNALIGALTNQPVLLDIGMASLTMAVRRERPLSPPPPLSPTGRRSSHSTEFQLAQEYEVALTASTDHLRNSTANSQASSPLEIASPTSLRSLAPGLLQRSNTLPLRPSHTTPPTRHISPAPSKTRSTSVSKASFIGSPLNPNSSPDGKPASPKTWMEAHQAPPSPQLAPVTEASDTTTRPGTFRSDSAQPGTGLWNAKPTTPGPGLWQKPANVPHSGPGSAALPVPKIPAPSRELQEKTKPTIILPGPPTIEDQRLEQWMIDQTTGISAPHGAQRSDTKTVTFAQSTKQASAAQSSSPNKSPADANGDDEHEHHIDEMSRWHDEERAGEHAPRIYKTPSEIRLHELGMKRRWTMNDERNQERAKDNDWRMEAWM